MFIRKMKIERHMQYYNIINKTTELVLHDTNSNILMYLNIQKVGQVDFNNKHIMYGIITNCKIIIQYKYTSLHNLEL